MSWKKWQTWDDVSQFQREAVSLALRHRRTAYIANLATSDIEGFPAVQEDLNAHIAALDLAIGLLLGERPDQSSE
jgi:hypothetical protein